MLNEEKIYANRLSIHEKVVILQPEKIEYKSNKE